MKLANETSVKNMMSEVLWRIKDAEELLKSRVSEVRMFAMINELKAEVKGSVSSGVDNNRQFIEEELNKINTNLKNEIAKTSTNFTDIKTVV